MHNGRKRNGEGQGGRREGASASRGRAGRCRGSTLNFHPPCLAAFAAILPVAAICSQTFSLSCPVSYQTPPCFLLRSPLCIGVLSAKLCKTVSVLLPQISLSNLPFGGGPQNSCRLSGVWGCARVCTCVCIGGTGSLLA